LEDIPVDSLSTLAAIPERADLVGKIVAHTGVAVNELDAAEAQGSSSICATISAFSLGYHDCNKLLRISIPMSL
jgi:hypothetical protein